MSAARGYLAASHLALAITIGLALASVALPGLAGSQKTVAVYAFVPLSLGAFTFHALDNLLGRPVREDRVRRGAGLILGGSILVAFGQGTEYSYAATAGLVLVLVGTLAMARGVLKALPARAESVTDVERDPLSKGDDACVAQLRFAHIFLALAMSVLVASHAPLPAPWGARLGLAGLHLLLVGYGVLAAYAIGHLFVPRFSGVPAIAAGAIKGELHSTLLGLVLLVAGFLSAMDGLVVAGGGFLFIGMFTYMGVLGANLMKRKSSTQRVTPEFVYIPFVFTGVFWLMAGLLLGLFLVAVPDLYASYRPRLQGVHANTAILGGFMFLLLGLSLRMLPAWTERPVPSFESFRLSFYGLFFGLLVMVLGSLVSPGGIAMWIGGVLLALGLGAYLLRLQGLMPPA